MVEQGSQITYPQLHDLNSTRILELTRTHQRQTSFYGRLVAVSLDERPDYIALSYVWGERSPNDPKLHVNGHELQVGMSLWQALEELTAHGRTVKLWVDQICIDQTNDIEREQQVQLMSRIYAQARQVVGWLGCHAEDSPLAFDLLLVLGRDPITHELRPDLKWRRAADAVIKDGHSCRLEYLFNPYLKLFQAVACLVRRSWFYRLWIVQEVALASTLEIRCGNSSISSDVFFGAIQNLYSAVSYPPMPALLKPYRNAHKLGQLRAQVCAGQTLSFPHLAHALSAWYCGRDHDRLNALFGLVFRSNQVWFKPSYRVSVSDLYLDFAQARMHNKKNLDILHFAGCGDNEAHTLSIDGQRILLDLKSPPDDVPSWVPDWRVQTRPLTLATRVEDGPFRFSATASDPEFEVSRRVLRVRARPMDKIKVCGLPYFESLARRLEITEHGIFNQWFSLAKNTLLHTDIKSMFASTLVMDGKVVVERQGIGANSLEVPGLFDHWAARNLHDFEPPCEQGCKDGVDESTRYGYIAEEVCRDRTFFITEAGRLGLGPTHTSPGDYIYLIHGLKTPFVLHRRLGMHVLRGECYVNGLMDGGVERSCADSFLYLE